MTYCSKLLLFGEYTLLTGSRALAVPFEAFSGQWDFGTRRPEEQDVLPEFAAYLQLLKDQGHLLAPLDIDRFRNDLEQGLYFQSNIPVGYGVGSSGAVCAAVYDRYGGQKIDPAEEAAFPELKAILAQLENFFHDSSSGIDPLISYVQKPLLLHPGGGLEPRFFSLPDLHSSYSFFLLDTGVPRQTGPLVRLFLDKCRDEVFSQRLARHLIPLSNEAIDRTLAGEWERLFGVFHGISAYQLQHFQEMIPAALQTAWAEGLEGRSCRLKLCGAGGGGFLLGISLDMEKTREELSSWKIFIVE